MQKGVTLLEMMLVLSIASGMTILGMNMYRSFQETVTLQQLQYNIDQLFEAAGNYYKANCATGGFSPSSITYPPTPTTYYPLSISSDLLARGFLTNWNATNPLVSPSGGESGYIVQLNPIIVSPVAANVCIVITPGVPCTPVSPTSYIPSTQALIVSWAVQVAVKIKNSSHINAYLATLQGNCTSDITSGLPNTVDPCPSVSATKNYIVWTRLPSMAAFSKNSVLSNSMPLLKQFNLQYTHDQNYELNSGYSTPVYYICGG